LPALSLTSADYRRATELYEEGIALCREHGYAGELAHYLADMAEEHMRQGHLQRAKDLLEEAAPLLREKEHGASLEFVLESQGWVVLLQGDHEHAKELHGEGLALCRKEGNEFVAISNLEGLASIAMAGGEVERAAKLHGAAHKLQESVGSQQPADQQALREPHLTTTRSQLDKETWEAAFAEGQAMTFEEAVEYALSEGEVSPAGGVDGSEASDDRPAIILTPREQEVAALVARGLTNRQVAQELSISEHTAANHVGRILRKLGLSSRTQIARWATEGQPSAPNRN
jgi:DNA-binding CsgD family transcriptional regulator